MRIKDTMITSKPFRTERKIAKKNTLVSSKAAAAAKEKAERNREMNKLFAFFMQITNEGTKIPRSLIDARQFSPRFKGEKGTERVLKFQWAKFHKEYKRVHDKYFDGLGA